MNNLYPASTGLDKNRWFNPLLIIKGFKNFRIGRKLDLGIGTLVTLMFLVVGSIFVAGRQATQNINLTEEVRVPAAMASTQAQSSLLEMQASVQGYLILSDLNHIDTYNKAKAVFEINLAQLEALSGGWANADDIRHLEELKATYAAWSPIPERLFQLHQNPLENQPALRIYSLDYRPTNAKLLAQLNDALQFQERKESVTLEDRQRLADLTDLETSFQAMATNLRAYVTSGDVAFKAGYAKNLDANTAAWRSLLAHRAGLTATEQSQLTALAETRSQLLLLPLQIIVAVEGKRTYEDLYLFKTEVEPPAKQMLNLLNEFTTTQQALLQTDLNTGRQSLNVAQQQTLLGGFMALMLGIVMAYVFRGHIVKPIQRLTQTAEEITAGDFTACAQVEARDEIGQLAATINTMTSRLRETIDRLAKLYHMSQGMMSAGTLSELIAVVVEGGNIPVINRAVLNVFEYNEAGEMQAMIVEANWYSGAGPRPSAPGTRYRRSTTGIINLFLSQGSLFFNDIQQDSRTDPATLKIVQELQIRAMAVLPLWSKRQQVGVLLLEGAEPYNFSPEEIHPYMALLGQLTVAVENRRLFEQVQQRANELAKATESAETASRAKSEFLTNMSHELRTPLNGILGYAQILKRNRHLDAAQANAVGVIQESGEHLLTLINDILDISKIEARKLELYPADFSLPDFLEGAVRMFQLRAQEKPEVAFIYQPLTAIPDTIRADEKRLRQVLINLLSNAFKFTDEGSVTLRIWAKNQTSSIQPAGGRRTLLRFEVEDTGIGMTAAQLEKIFLPFEQVGDVRYRVKGTGLGLAITRNLVEAMGGTLAVDSAPGQGSCFKLDLEFPVTSPAGRPWAMLDDEIVAYAGPSHKILVVDDEPYNRSVLVDVLAPLGFEVIEARSGQESIEATTTLQPDAILMDLIMPDMSGLEAVKAIRQSEQLRDERMVIIATSANVFEEAQRASKLAGCDAFLPKPIAVEQLLGLLATHLDLKWVYGETTANGPAVSHNKLDEEAEIITPPALNELTLLLDLALKGDLSSLQKRASRLAQTNAAFSPFAAKLRRLVDQVDEEQILALLHHCINLSSDYENSRSQTQFGNESNGQDLQD